MHRYPFSHFLFDFVTKMLNDCLRCLCGNILLIIYDLYSILSKNNNKKLFICFIPILFKICRTCKQQQQITVIQCCCSIYRMKKWSTIIFFYVSVLFGCLFSLLFWFQLTNVSFETISKSSKRPLSVLRSWLAPTESSAELPRKSQSELRPTIIREKERNDLSWKFRSTIQRNRVPGMVSTVYPE